MDKNTLSNYGWIVIAVLVLSVMIALSTPFGEYIKAGVWSTTEGLFDVQESALNVVGIDAGNTASKNKIIELPTDFNDAPITLMSNGTDYTVEHDFTQYVYDTSIYVDRDNGSDSTGDGSEGNPYKTIKKATDSVTTDTNIYVKSSKPFMRGEFPTRYNINHSVSFFNNNSDGSNILATSAQTGLSWATENNVFKASRSQVTNILYKDDANTTFGWSNLLEVASIEECKATSGSFYTDNTDVYINTFDGAVPTTDNYLVVLNEGANKFYLAEDSMLYIEGFTFISADVTASVYFDIASEGIENTRVVVRNCVAGQNDTNTTSGIAGNAFSFKNIKEVLVFDCIAKDTHLDGFSYHYEKTINPSECLVVEANCEAYNCGIKDGSDINNLSTCHEGARIIRVNTYGRNSGGPLIADVGGCKSLNFGCDIGGSGLSGWSYQFGGTEEGYALLAGCKDDGYRTNGTMTTVGTLYLYDFEGKVYNNGNTVETLDSLEDIASL